MDFENGPAPAPAMGAYLQSCRRFGSRASGQLAQSMHAGLIPQPQLQVRHVTI
jgi:hypothetical protein